MQQLEVENNKVTDKLTSESLKRDMLDFEMKTLKAKNADLNERLKMVLPELNTGKTSLNMMSTVSKKLDDILCSQKVKIDKLDISNVDEASSSNSKGKNCLVKSLVDTNHVVNVVIRVAK